MSCSAAAMLHVLRHPCIAALQVAENMQEWVVQR